MESGHVNVSELVYADHKSEVLKRKLGPRLENAIACLAAQALYMYVTLPTES